MSPLNSGQISVCKRKFNYSQNYNGLKSHAANQILKHVGKKLSLTELNRDVIVFLPNVSGHRGYG